MRRFGMGRPGRTIRWMAGMIALCAVGAGCQSKLYDENAKLRDQNRELQARNEELSAMKAAPASPMLAEPVRPAPPPLPPVTQTPGPEAAGPAPMPPEDLTGIDKTVTAETTTLNFLGDALFDPGQASIKSTAKPNLDKVASALKKQYAGKPVRVQGHTDSDPIHKSKWASNMELSQARADAVKKYLVSKGTESGRIDAEGFGDTKPKDTATTTAAKAKNRRVEIVVVTK